MAFYNRRPLPNNENYTYTYQPYRSPASPAVPQPPPPPPPYTPKAAPAKLAPRAQTSYDLNARPKTAPHASVPRAASVPPGEVAREPPSNEPSTARKAYGEARYFLGGLVNHPEEHNKHYTILRHSHGLVYYRGPNTTIALTVFSDKPLPEDRTYYLQDKGFTGRTGMKIKGLFDFIREDWINVTPKIPLKSEQVNPEDERAWQRDIKKLTKKDLKAGHVVRETVILRVPALAEDGYWAVVLCRGEHEKVLCTSPTFRVMSTSVDPSSIRGASIKTLPFEIGAMVASSALTSMTSNVTSPVVKPISDAVQPYKPGAMSQAAFDVTYAIMEDDINERNAQFARVGPSEEGFEIEKGPTQPFPIRFRADAKAKGSIVRAEGSLPGILLDFTKLPGNLLDRLSGHYICWTRFLDAGSQSNAFYQSVLDVQDADVTQMSRVTINTAIKRTAHLRVLTIHKLPSPVVNVEVRVMAFIRESIPPGTNTELVMVSKEKDVEQTFRVLSQSAWHPNAGPESVGLLDRHAKVEVRGQGLTKKLPVEKLGIRQPTAMLRDRQITVNGFYIPR